MGFQTAIRAENFLSVEKELEVLSNSFHKVTKFAEDMDYNLLCKNVMPDGDGGEGCKIKYILMYSS